MTFYSRYNQILSSNSSTFAQHLESSPKMHTQWFSFINSTILIDLTNDIFPNLVAFRYEFTGQYINPSSWINVHQGYSLQTLTVI